jgi:hypothetical protein
MRTCRAQAGAWVTLVAAITGCGCDEWLATKRDNTPPPRLLVAYSGERSTGGFEGTASRPSFPERPSPVPSMASPSSNTLHPGPEVSRAPAVPPGMKPPLPAFAGGTPIPSHGKPNPPLPWSPSNPIIPGRPNPLQNNGPPTSGPGSPEVASAPVPGGVPGAGENDQAPAPAGKPHHIFPPPRIPNFHFAHGVPAAPPADPGQEDEQPQ